MDCPNRTTDDKVMKCSLLPNMIFVAPPHKLNRCGQCETQWQNGQPPTEAVLTETILSIRHDQKMPTLLNQAKHLATDAAAAVANGLQTASAEEQARRIAICESNECGYFRADVRKCASCGCNMDLRKMQAAWHCPVGKW